MQSESDSPIEGRYLWLEGRASAEAVKMVQGGLPRKLPPDTQIFFVGFSYADLQVGKEFSVIFPKDRPLESANCVCRIVAVTQQFGRSFEEIPHGWKTICAIQFPSGIPPLVRALPVVESWHGNVSSACISSPATVEALCKAYRSTLKAQQ